MNENQKAYISVLGLEAKRTNGILPGAYGVLYFSAKGVRRLWGHGFFKDSQDLFACAIAYTLNECSAAKTLENSDQLEPDPIAFFVEKAGFIIKFGEIESRMGLREQEPKAKSYHSENIWREAKTLFVMSDSTISADHDDDFADAIKKAKSIARRFAEATGKATNATEVGLIKEGEAGPSLGTA